jgi:glucan 1,3-beta-glucosidase
MIRLGLLFALTAAVIGFVWHQLGQPAQLPAGLDRAQKLNCLSYAPFRGEQTPFDGERIPDEQIADDLKRLAKVAPCIRTYSAMGAQGKITRIAGDLGLKVRQGIWIGRNRAENRREIEAALRLARQNPGVIEAIIVGNEVLLRGEQSSKQIAAYLREVRRRSGLPVTYADVWEFWLEAPELADAVDFVTIHILPYWEDVPIRPEEAVARAQSVLARSAAAFAPKTLWIGEVGWPTEGRMRGSALPSRYNQALLLASVISAAAAHGWEVNVIEAYDQPWKRLLEGTVGGYWGVFDDKAREPKFIWGGSISNHPDWPLKAGLGIFAAFLVFAAAWLGRRSKREAIAWREALAVAAIALASGLVFGWAALGLPMEPPIPGDRMRSALMLVLSLLVPIAAGAAVAEGVQSKSMALALDPERWKRSNALPLLLTGLFIATAIAAVHIALGLVFEPRYKDFQLALLTGPVAALAVLTFRDGPSRPRPGPAEQTLAALLAASAVFIIVHEGLENWQAAWLGGLLLVLALTALWTAPPARD